MLMEEAAGLDPSSSRIQYNLGVAYHRASRLDDAIRAYDRALALDPSLLECELQAARLLASDGRYRGALIRLRRAIAQDPERIDLRVGLVDVHRLMGDHDTAIEEATSALAINASDINLYRSMGESYLARGETLLARFILQKALDTLDGAKQSGALHESLGRAHQKDGNTELAKAFYEKALELDENLYPSRIYLAALYMGNRDYETTVGLLERAVTLRPRDAGMLVTLGVAHRGMGNFDEAERSYLRAADADPSSADPWFNLGILYGDYQRDYDRAQKMFQRYLDENGLERELAETYLRDLAREKKRSARRRDAEADRKKREAERLERQRLLDEADAAESSQEGLKNDAPSSTEE
jgi:tetratricopeptide (TPR) repeat protein